MSTSVMGDKEVGKSLNYDNNALISRDKLFEKLQNNVQEMVSKLVTLTIFKELPSLASGASDDQILVDETLDTLSRLLCLIINGGASLGSTLQNTDFSTSNVKGAESLSMSLLMSQQPIDDRGIYWMRSLVKSKTLHSAVESLLLFASDNGTSPQVPTAPHPTFNSIEAILLLNHKQDLISTLSLVKTAPLKFSVEAPLPAP